MSHVDEGTLHAYLDGALDALPAAEAARVREHLATCGACAARLEEERQVRQEAVDILGAAAPASIDPPAFEEVRALARARGRPARTASRLSRLGWAASVVLALGAGWMLRDAAMPDFAREGFVRDEARQAEEATADVADAGEAERQKAEGDRDVPTPTPTGQIRGRRQSRRAGVRSPPARRFHAGARRGRVEGEPADGGASDARRSAERAHPAGAVVAARRGDRGAGDHRLPLRHAHVPAHGGRGEGGGGGRGHTPAGRRGQRAAPTQRPAPLPVSGAGQDLGRVRSAALPLADRRNATLFREAASGTTGSLVVPGLEVLSVAGLDGEGLPGGVRVRQRLAGGDTLELVHLPAGMTPSMLEPVAPDTRTELVLPRAGGWLVVRAHATRDVLMELVRRMDEGG